MAPFPLEAQVASKITCKSIYKDVRNWLYGVDKNTLEIVWFMQDESIWPYSIEE